MTAMPTTTDAGSPVALACISELGVHEVCGWRIKVYRIGAIEGEPCIPPEDAIGRIFLIKDVRAGESRAPVGFCVLEECSGGVTEALLGVWLVSGATSLVQTFLRIGERITFGRDVSLSIAEVVSFEIRAMRAASQEGSDPDAMAASYLSQWAGAETSQPSRATMRATLRQFANHWRRGEIDGLMDQMSGAPSYRTSSGSRFEGRAAVREGFTRMCKPEPGAAAAGDEEPQGVHFFGNRSLSYWSLRLPASDGVLQDVEGVDIITYDADGRILLKDAYRKTS